MSTFSWFVLAFALGGGSVTGTSLLAMEDRVAQDSVVASGQFVRIDRSHWARGEATLARVGNELIVEFGDDFEAARGPDLRVLLSPHPDPRSAHELGAYVELGKLGGNEGAQRYMVSGDVDVAAIRSVVIFCNPYEVVFSTATLVAP